MTAPTEPPQFSIDKIYKMIGSSGVQYMRVILSSGDVSDNFSVNYIKMSLNIEISLEIEIEA